jgi:hypothetical protein
MQQLLELLQGSTPQEGRMMPAWVVIPVPAISQGLGLIDRGGQLGIEELIP